MIFVEPISYRVLLRKEPERGFTAIVSSLQGCISYGGTIDEAIEMVREAIVGYVESLEAHGEAILTEKDVLE